MKHPKQQQQTKKRTNQTEVSDLPLNRYRALEPAKGEMGFHSREVMSRFLSVTLNRMLRTHHHLLTWLSEDVCGPRFSNFSLFPSGLGVPNVQQRPLEIQLTNSSGMSSISVQSSLKKFSTVVC